jgi:hypothetical protein
MDKKMESFPNKASFDISVKEGQLRIGAKVPVRWLRWMLILSGIVTATMGYPQLLEILGKLSSVIK